MHNAISSFVPSLISKHPYPYFNLNTITSAADILSVDSYMSIYAWYLKNILHFTIVWLALSSFGCYPKCVLQMFYIYFSMNVDFSGIQDPPPPRLKTYFGDRGGTRTLDHVIKSHGLCQLSYAI